VALGAVLLIEPAATYDLREIDLTYSSTLCHRLRLRLFHRRVALLPATAQQGGGAYDHHPTLYHEYSPVTRQRDASGQTVPFKLCKQRSLPSRNKRAQKETNRLADSGRGMVREQGNGGVGLPGREEIARRDLSWWGGLEHDRDTRLDVAASGAVLALRAAGAPGIAELMIRLPGAHRLSVVHPILPRGAGHRCIGGRHTCVPLQRQKQQRENKQQAR
jgi:hypothetical protein